jgi:hypothetical protein
MTTKPYVPKEPGDIIRSKDWNDMQIGARNEIRSHTHGGEEDGKQLPRSGIAPQAIDGSLIDPNAEVTLRSLTTGELKVNGQSILDDLAALQATIKGLDNEKVNRGGDTITGPLSIRNDVIRKVTMATGIAQEVALNDGVIPHRMLNFTKYYSETAIRIFYCDNLRVSGNNVAARWEICIDNNPLPPEDRIFQDKYSGMELKFEGGGGGPFFGPFPLKGSAILNLHSPTTMLGYAKGISTGPHTITVRVGSVEGVPLGNVVTGWHGARWTLEAQEVWI